MGQEVDHEGDHRWCGDQRLDTRSIAARGRKAVLESRRAAKQFPSTGRIQITSRNLGFRVANAMINSRIVRRRDVPATSPLI